MEKWKGIISFGDYSIDAIIFYKRPEQYSLGEWRGYGLLQEQLSLDLIGKTVETDVGSILIIKLSYENREIEFRGTGPIKGPLAEAMGV